VRPIATPRPYAYVGFPPRAPADRIGIDPSSLAAPHDRIGFVAPTIIYDKMREIDTLAKDLGPKIITYVADDPAFVRAWQDFDAEWTPFFQKYQGNYAKLGAVFYTDDLNQRVDSFRTRINDLYAKYQTHHQPNGQPVPPPAAAPIPVTPPSGPNAPRAGYPWWFWTLFGVGIVGAAYAGYRYVVRAQALKKGIQEEILPGLIGPRLAKLAARDPEEVYDLRSTAYGHHRDPREVYGLRSAVYGSPRDRDPRAYGLAPDGSWPRTLEDFASDPRAERAAARGFIMPAHLERPIPRRPPPPRRDPYARKGHAEWESSGHADWKADLDELDDEHETEEDYP
jgi:hypothetical protein